MPTYCCAWIPTLQTLGDSAYRPGDGMNLIGDSAKMNACRCNGTDPTLGEVRGSACPNLRFFLCRKNGLKSVLPLQSMVNWRAISPCKGLSRSRRVRTQKLESSCLRNTETSISHRGRFPSDWIQAWLFRRSTG